jgi:hypothetical protein
MSAFVLSLAVMSAAWAAETTEEKTLAKESAEISKTAGKTQGATVVTARLEKEFNVTEVQIQALRDKKLGYGEIAIMFSLAQKKYGSVTDETIGSIVTLRQGPPTMGWGEVAKKIDLKLGPTVSQMRNVNRETNREMGREAKAGKGGAGAMEQHQERSMERHGEMGGGHETIGGGAGSSHGKGR